MQVTTTNLEVFKKHLDKMLITAQNQLRHHDGIQSYFVTNDDTTIDKAPISLSPEMKDIEAIEVEMICTNPLITSSALILDVNKLEVPEDEVANYKDVVIKDHPQSVKAIMVILYTSDVSYVRVMPYRKKASGDYWFGDMGWREAPEVIGTFKNPHKI